ncbi:MULTISPECIES: flagellar biosynthetic protein FliR [Methylobacterium]|uniref:Flagellar biosynthetic protein FliR n=1 Tax=Methylobacterium longum TaxID=767694 RepID=A0ABT8ALX5_9HYPH|nr:MULTISPECIES: flagellar biosynthetic protein FliR [Methylobacterium]MCJ2102499.1 flagellar type III secretion system protein FliR [Methylobacterium sp. E-046]MDN3570283.1 flagellar biosynthetic protein FliR [Methylobacterium longum]GJE11280.1 Flagellar biosynthetic protein FliR [Methylobacterium longum]
MNLLLPGIASAYLIAFARIGTLIMLMPGVGEQTVPPRLRLAFALLTTLVLFPSVRPLLGGTEGLASPRLIGLLFGETIIGLVLGLTVRMVLAALQTAGVIVAAQLGLSYAMTVDPAQGGQQVAIGNFLSLLGITLIFATDLHHLAIQGLARSYEVLPPDGVPAFSDALMLATRALARGFTLAVQISGPFIAFGILFNLGLGVLSRLMPQLQVFFLAVPASVMIGMLILIGCLGVMMGVFLDDIGRYLAESVGR